MSIQSEEPLQKETQMILETLGSLTSDARHDEIWGTDLNEGEPRVVRTIVQKFLQQNAIIPSLQVPKTSSSLAKTLLWRRRATPRALMDQAKSILPELGLFYITKSHERCILWATIDEMTMRGFSSLHDDLSKFAGIRDLGVAAMELLATLLLSQAADKDGKLDQVASCVLEFRLHQKPGGRPGYTSFRSYVRKALRDLVALIPSHYPCLFDKTYIISPSHEYLASFDIAEYLQRNTLLLEKPEDLALHLGSDIPSKYGGSGRPLAEVNCLKQVRLDTEDQKIIRNAPGVEEKGDSSTTDRKTFHEQTSQLRGSSDSQQSESASKQPDLRLIYSEVIGAPTIILDPEDLKDAEDLIPNKMGAHLAWADTNMLVKFGHGVRLAEAEALHLVSTRTTIPVPQLLSAYILDGTGYIIMSYEHGTPFEKYWDGASQSEQQRLLAQLADYVQQMREIKGDFIGGLDRSPCRDGVFEGGYGDYTKYSYGPYESEETFNEGMVQALRDRLPSKLLESENDPESMFWTREYILYQTVRALKGHTIVFTHGDLHGGNTLVRSDGTVVLLDWGLSGFWPEYWEFYRAMFNPPWRTSWDRMVERFIPPYYVEYDVMKRIFGTIWY
ncbi:kinase-like domain-containing protein [Aspergillus coremiiformis]|uniref:Kinase-like domain-containing protein n=1 Tax=Aspergillus coremiiformis TaxID=138285 RepID=A0A5N6Z3F8_9EURO|nr:kinase-like domain-containing protein [Aspergillus coremiiformis]